MYESNCSLQNQLERGFGIFAFEAPAAYQNVIGYEINHHLNACHMFAG